MHISVVVGQFPISFDIQRNVHEIMSFVQQAQADELLVLPEGALSGYADDSSFLYQLDTVQLDAAMDVLAQAAYQKGVHLIFGSCIFEGDNWWNTGLYFSPTLTRFVYRKVNLAAHERSHFSAGSELPVFPIQFKQGTVMAGMQLCREIRFPEQWRALALGGAELFIYLTNATNPRAHLSVWRSHLVSRAAENQRFLLSANAAHEHQHCPTMLIAPSGEVLQELISNQKGCLRAMLDLSQNSDWYLSQRRTDIAGLSSL